MLLAASPQVYFPPLRDPVCLASTTPTFIPSSRTDLRRPVDVSASGGGVHMRVLASVSLEGRAVGVALLQLRPERARRGRGGGIARAVAGQHARRRSQETRHRVHIYIYSPGRGVVNPSSLPSLKASLERDVKNLAKWKCRSLPESIWSEATS